MLFLRWLFCIIPLAANAGETIDNNWFPVKETSQIIKKGSPLDFSSLVGDIPAGKRGRVIIDKTGHFAFSNLPNEQQRFLCASTDLSNITGGFPSHQITDLYVKQLKLRGYNLVRIHSIEAYLMTGQKNDFEFDPVSLDRFHYFLAALKKEGIYWLVNGLTSQNGAYGDVRPHRWIKKHELKLKLYYDDLAKQHWKNLIVHLWHKKNPYTGLTTLEDPALVGMILVNENGLNYLLRSSTPEPIKRAFNVWLKKKYSTTEALKRSWGRELKAYENIEQGRVATPESVKKRSPRQVDFQQFINFKEQELAAWQIEYLKSLGYQGLVTGYDNWYSLSASKGRSSFDWIDMHYYHDENFMWSPNFRMKQTSSLDNDVKYVRHLAGSAELGKPFTVSEYGHAFWNNYRYESGLVFSSLASLQDWDMICQYSQGAIDLSFAPPTAKASRKKAIYPYNIGMDPVLRAGETLSSLLFLRKDVKPSGHLIIADYSNDKWLSGQGFNFVSNHINKLSFISKLRISFDSQLESKNDSQLIFDNNDWIRFSLPGKLASNVSKLTSQGFIDDNNLTKISLTSQLFNSDTNEIFFNKNEQSFKVNTSKTIASLINEKTKLTLGSFFVTNVSSNGMFAISSIDGKAIENSSKLLIIMTSNARNTSMVLSDNDRKLENIGEFPVLIKRLSLDLSFQTNKEWLISRLSLNGDVMETQSVKKGHFLSINIDNYSSKFGPTTYFLLSEVFENE